MKTQIQVRALHLLLLLLFCLSFPLVQTRAAYPGWINDVDNHNGYLWIGYGGSLLYVAYNVVADAQEIYRWPPRPEEEDEYIATLYNYGGVSAMAIRDGYLYLAGGLITNVGNYYSSADVHGIAKIDLGTLQISDVVSVRPPMPNIYGLVWDHNGSMYVAGSTTTGGAHYDTNMFMRWTGSAWATVGGGIAVNNDDQSMVRCMESDGTNIFLGGAFVGYKQSNGTTNSAVNIMRWNVDSATFAAVGSGLRMPTGQAIAQRMTIGGTNLFVTGIFTNVSESDGGMARFSTVSLTAQPFGTIDFGTAAAYDVITFNGDAYVAGTFQRITNGATVTTVTGIAKWSNGTWSALGSGINGDANAVTTNINSVFVGGGFNSAGGLSCTYSARWQLAADIPTRFTAGTISGTSVSLTLASTPDLPCVIQRLDFPSDNWVYQGRTTPDGSGVATFNSSVTNGLGYFRARSIDGAYLSTNAFGSIVTNVPPGNWLVGSPFEGRTLSEMFPAPADGMVAYYMTNGSFLPSTYDALDGRWSENRGFVQGEGMLTFIPGGSNPTFQTYGLFSTNSFSRTLPTGYSIIASPLFHKYAGGSATQIDEFDSTRRGGYSQVPVNSTSNPKSRASRNKAGISNQYIDYTLTTTGDWQTNSVSTTVPILLGEGVWLENRFGSSQTWAVPLTIW